MKFIEFPKMPRFSREVIITEKIDGTNACISLTNPLADEDTENVICLTGGFNLRIGSRTKWISPTDDNHGFANWVMKNLDCLSELGEGTHFGEWWGSGIQRGYGLTKGEKKFSLFNTSRWSVDRPACCSVTPVLWTGNFDDINYGVKATLADLSTNGSKAAPGFMKPEGIVIFHVAGNFGFKKTIDKDETPKSLQS